jgi:hypothetical protein
MLGAIAGCSAIHQQIVASARQPGEHITTTPERLWREVGCEKRQRPFVQVESMEVLPEMIKPGGRVNYRLTYIMCPVEKFTETVKTQVSRNILYKGTEVARNVRDLELKSGRWAVDSFFTLPADAPKGVYALEVALKTPKGQTLKQARSFVVSDEFYLSGE